MKRVAIIGAGASGLPAIKCCLDEGLEPVCFERTEDIGGLWNYKEQTHDGQATVMKSTISNTSKEMMCYSDFPIPAEFPNFMHNTKVMEYFHMYAKEFKLENYIRFKTEITKIEQSPNFEKTGQWDVGIHDLITGKTATETFDAILLCTGHHADKHTPHFEGEETFKGTRVHANDYRDYHEFENKKVVIIGIGNSGGDIAVELGKSHSEVYLSTRRGCWVGYRIGPNGRPADCGLSHRFLSDTVKFVPRCLINYYQESRLNKRFDHALYGLKPEHRWDSQHPMVNDDLPNCIASGRVIIKPNVRRITETGVEFKDGSVIDNVDAIIFATGYKFGFPIVKHKALSVHENQVNLFKFTFPPEISPPTIAVIGCVQPLGALMPLSEMQCRLAVSVFKGEKKLPSAEIMWKDIRDKKVQVEKLYYKSQRHTIQVHYLPFMDELAELYGCKPDMFRLLRTDPVLALKMYFGPCTPYQFRLEGPGAWSGARQAMLTTCDRTICAFGTKKPVNCFLCSSWLRLVLVYLLAIIMYHMFT